ncbi:MULTISPECIES: class D sortase [unclassified Paenibacillus]|uniref:class D sortase n=1 Tax=unclassified Paenibacillus TaxID=185978 RepID=UPI001043F43A|nr:MULTISPECIES: class D sortase [unclassified Paenibacillus]NIK68201.1 sortase A [Paenibacillus sp. BK720]TCM99582.1 sortase A [Paenibacillus sp. BK033]
MIKKIAPILLILAGLLIFLYPTIKDRYEIYQQRQILKAWEDNLQRIDQVPIDAQNTTADEQDQTPASVSPALTGANSADDMEQRLQSKGIGKKSIEGVLIIDKINLKLPIITNATQAHLALSVASILHTGKPGQIGNYAIAGHRSHTYGKNFNRLDEIEIGDRIQVQTADETFTYIVNSKQYVKPTQVEVLEGNGKDSEITLITCHPLYKPTQRIIVKGILAENQNAES